MLEPATSIIRKFGGPSKVAEITGAHRTRVSNWMRAKESGGTGGSIPLKHASRLVAYAAKSGISVSADEFLVEPHASDPALSPSDREATQ